MIIFHDPHCVEYSAPGHPERAARITRTVPLLKERHPKWTWREPRAPTEKELLRAHSREHISEVKNPAGDFDLDTPAYPKIDTYARQTAGAGIETARTALKGERAFALMRPPGHHATRDQAMGFCYFNNIAVAALDALENGADRVAIWDFDAHHGMHFSGDTEPLTRYLFSHDRADLIAASVATFAFGCVLLHRLISI